MELMNGCKMISCCDRAIVLMYSVLQLMFVLMTSLSTSRVISKKVAYLCGCLQNHGYSKN